MAAIVNTRDVALQATSPRMVPVTLDSGVIIPALKGILLTAPSTVFKVTAGGVATPTSIVLTATNRQVTGTISWSVVTGTATLTGSGSSSPSSRTLAFANLSSASATIRASVTENSVTYTADFTIAKVQDGAAGTNGTNGTNGANGERGSIHGYGTPYALYLSGTDDTTDPWPSTSTNARRANRVIQNILTGASLTTDLTTTTHLRVTDSVTMTNAGNTAVETRIWAGAGGWIKPGTLFDGNLIVTGTVAANKLGVNELSAIAADLGTVTAGEITGTADINITGFAQFEGVTSEDSAVLANSSFSATIGARAYGGGATGIGFSGSGQSAGVQGVGSGSGTANGVAGFIVTSSATGSGVHGSSSVATALGVRAQNANASGTAFSAYNTAASKQMHGATAGFAAFSPSGGGKQYFVDGAGPFTGFHPALGLRSSAWVLGDILVDEQILFKPDVSNSWGTAVVSSRANQPGAMGVLSAFGELPREIGEAFDYALWWELTLDYLLLDANALGEGLVNVCGEGGAIEVGDLIVTSSLPGKGMRQADGIVRSHTVAKAREAVTFEPGEIKQIACFYLCG